jgi:thiol:disulfide interchange protein DsbC
MLKFASFNRYGYGAGLGLLLAAVTTLTSAQTQEANIKKLIEPRLGDGAKVTAVTKTPYSGLYEVQVDGDILYTDANAKYLFVGRVVDTQTYKDYTKARIDAITAVKFSDLPLNLAMKTVKGDGSRTIAVFEDPNCGYCKQFQKTLKTVDNVTVYTFMYNILSPDSIVRSKNVWCSPNPTQAWRDWMVDGKTTPDAPAACMSTPHEKVLALGQKLKVTGTPTIFFADGTRIPGAIDAAGLEAKFKALYPAKS